MYKRQGDDNAGLFWYFLDEVGQSGIKHAHPDDGSDSPEKAVQKVYSSCQVKRNFAVVPENGSEYNFRKYAADVFIGPAQKRSHHENEAVAAVSVLSLIHIL